MKLPGIKSILPSQWWIQEFEWQVSGNMHTYQAQFMMLTAYTIDLFNKYQ